jgi:hypothetical protein
MFCDFFLPVCRCNVDWTIRKQLCFECDEPLIVPIPEQCNYEYEHEIRAMKLTTSLSIARAADHESCTPRAHVGRCGVV